MNPQPLHIYVHWPWCQQKCPYCDFNSHALPGKGVANQRVAYIDHLKAELAWWQPQLAAQRPIASVFFGGGTPSLMTSTEIGSVIKSLQAFGVWQNDTEVTLECNPASITEHQDQNYFTALKAEGVTRVSIGVQGLKAEWLGFLGRGHSVENAKHTLAAAQNAVLRVNADVIYGLPTQSLPEWEDQLQQLATMGLEHIAAYQLTIEPNTAFWGQVQQGLWQPLDTDSEADFFAATRAILTARGYENYEISNFAKPGGACRHNLGVWRGEDYLGIGAGAHGGVHLANGTFVRTATRKHPEAYLKYPIIFGHPNHFATWQTPNAAQQVQDALFAGLRLSEGVALKVLCKTHGEAVFARALDKTALALFKQQNWLETYGVGDTERLRLTPTGWPLLSGLLKELLPTLKA
jgi:oxygen-independent coproporphyrinogen-3 oxidase